MTTKDEIIHLIYDGKMDEIIKLGLDPSTGVVEELIGHILFVTPIKKLCMSALAEIGKKDETVPDKLIEKLMFASDRKSMEAYISVLGLIKGQNIADALLLFTELKEAATSAELVSLVKTDKNVLLTFLKMFALRSPNHLFREKCAVLLNVIEDVYTVGALIKGLNDPYSLKVRIVCANSLLRISKSNDMTQIERGLKNELIETLFSKLQAEDPFEKLYPQGTFNSETEITDYCSKALGEIGRSDETVFNRLLKELSGENISVARRCAIALGITKKQKATEELIVQLASNNRGFRLACAKALEQINDQRGLHFKRIIHDKDESYGIEIGLENTLKTIIDYLDLIKDHYSKDEMKQIRSDLFLFYRRVSEKIKESKGKIDILLPASILKPRKEPGISRIEKIAKVGT